jgi:hypothetical protein
MALIFNIVFKKLKWYKIKKNFESDEANVRYLEILLILILLLRKRPLKFGKTQNALDSL